MNPIFVARFFAFARRAAAAVGAAAAIDAGIDALERWYDSAFTDPASQSDLEQVHISFERTTVAHNIIRRGGLSLAIHLHEMDGIDSDLFIRCVLLQALMSNPTSPVLSENAIKAFDEKYGTNIPTMYLAQGIEKKVVGLLIRQLEIDGISNTY